MEQIVFSWNALKPSSFFCHRASPLAPYRGSTPEPFQSAYSIKRLSVCKRSHVRSSNLYCIIVTANCFYLCSIVLYPDPCADPERFARRGPTLTTFFSSFLFLLVDEGREDPNTTISHHWPASETPSARHLNGVSLACRCYR